MHPLIERRRTRPWPSAFTNLRSGLGLLSFGEALSQVALPIIAVVLLNASTFTAAALVAAEQVAWPVLGLPAGVLVDRLPKKALVLTAQAIRMCLIGSVAATYAFGVLTVAQLYGVAVIGSVATVFGNTAQTSLLPAVVGKADLVSANGTLSSTRNVGDLAGKSACGLLIEAVRAPIAVLADVAATAAALICTARLSVPSVPSRGDKTGSQDRHFGSELLAGIRYTFSDAQFRAIISITALTNFLAVGQFAVLTVFVFRSLHSPAAVVGYVIAVSSIGGIVAGALLGRLSARFGQAALWTGSLVCLPLASTAVPLSPHWPWILPAVIGLFASAAALAFVNVLGSALRQAVCPPTMLGRLTATTAVITGGVVPVGAIASGVLGQVIGVPNALFCLAGLYLLPLALQLRLATRGAEFAWAPGSDAS